MTDVLGEVLDEARRIGNQYPQDDARDLAEKILDGADTQVLYRLALAQVAQVITDARGKTRRDVEKGTSEHESAQRRNMNQRGAYNERRTAREKYGTTDAKELHDIAVREAQAAIQEVASSMHFEITNELLSTSVRFGDNTSLTWGEMTAGDHQRRIDYLSNQYIYTNLEDCARHEYAITKLQTEGVRTLGDLPNDKRL